MKTDYLKVNGGVVNADVANEYEIALKRRERSILINSLIKLEPDIKKMLEEFETIKIQLEELKSLKELIESNNDIKLLINSIKTTNK